MGTGTDGTGGNTTTYGWDARNNAVSQKLPLGATASVSAYQTVAGTDLPNDFTTADGRKDSYKYDANGNTMSVTTTGTAGATREYTYNEATPECGGFEGQRCTAKDGNGKVTSFTYDDEGNLIKVKPPAPLGETTYTYDALGRVETVEDGRGITTVYGYDSRDRVREVSSTNFTVTYTYDGDGNVTTRSDASGFTKWKYDELNRESVRTLQNGAQTALAYTPGGDVDFYTDPTGTTDYTWDKAGRLDYLVAPDGAKTDFDYNNNDKRTKTVYPGGTTQAVTIDDNGRPERIKTTSGTQTFVDLTYSYASVGKDTTKIRTRTDHLTNLKTSYTYDSQDRLSYALEADSAGARKASWLYCWDKAGNLTSQNGSKSACPGGTTYTYNDASELTGKNGSTTGWSYDKLGNETDAASGTARTDESWTDYSQLAGITTGGTNYDLVHAGTTNAERTKLASTWFHHTALGLASTTTNGVDTGFIREPSGTLNSMTTGGSPTTTSPTPPATSLASSTTPASGRTPMPTVRRARPEAPPPRPPPSRTATPAPTPTRPACTRWATATTTPPSAASHSPTPPARKPTPTSTPPATRSTGPTPPACSASRTFWTPVVKSSAACRVACRASVQPHQPEPSSTPLRSEEWSVPELAARSALVPPWWAVVRWEASRATTEPTSSPTDDVQSDANQTIYRGVT